MTRLIVTRPAAQARRWVDALSAEGLAAVALPLIEIAPVADAAPLRRAWDTLATRRFVMFVSGNAVAAFFAHRPAAIAWPKGLRAGATGPGTAEALREAGVPETAVVLPRQAAGGSWDAETLWQRIRGDDWRAAQVLVVRGEDGRDWLAGQWRDAGAEVEFVAAYRRCLPLLDATRQALLREAIAQPARLLWLFSSSEAVANLARLAPAGTDWSRSRALATHARIVAAAQAAGFGQVLPTAPELAAVAAALRAAAAA